MTTDRRHFCKVSACLGRVYLGPVCLGLALLLALGAGCGERTQPQPRFEDFIVSGEFTSNRGVVEPAQVSFADETHFSRFVGRGEVLTAQVQVGSSARLVLSGSLLRIARKFKQLDGTLEVTLEGDGWSQSHSLHLADKPEWWTQEVDLSHLAGENLTIRLEAKLPRKRGLHLRDFYVEHRRDVALRRKAVPQVLLISVDTLRADALGAFGGKNVTPHLDRFAAEGQTWSPHYSAAGWTKPSHAALLTGQPADVYGGMEGTIDPDVTTLAERFQRAGFRTGGLVHDCVWLNPQFGFDRGFEDYQSVRWQLAKTTRQTINWLAEHHDQPFFFFSHTFEVHSDFHRIPYESEGIDRAVVQERFGPKAYGCREHRCASGLLAAIDRGEIAKLDREAETLKFLYGKSVEYLDSQLGLLFDSLREMGLYDDMTIVLTSDHGESFFEHDELLHGNPWQQILHVPLIIKWPAGRFAGEQRTQPSSALDVAPTLLESLDLDSQGLAGVSLLNRRLDRPIFAGTHWRVVIQEDLKAIFNYQGVPARLFDLSEDPEELHNLHAERRQETAALHHLLTQSRQAFRRRQEEAQRLRSQAGATGLTEADKERLRSLGYLGGE
ncbi:MAG: sulfatase [Deltaproteobacteria bacterium]|nr:sulfatase [Deltaproteobacteria bacterium]